MPSSSETASKSVANPSQQIRRSRRPDKQLAQGKLAELRSKIDQLDTGDAAKIAFSLLDNKGKVMGGLLRQYINHKLGNMQAKNDLCKMIIPAEARGDPAALIHKDCHHLPQTKAGRTLRCARLLNLIADRFRGSC